jgi:GR25 family glycosyltransferase involved in LPS biosynthesis
MNDFINYFIIHCEQHVEREHHLKKIVKLFNDKITIFKGYYTKNISVDYNNKINFFKSIDRNMDMKINVLSKSGEIGCYLSHHMLIKYIHENSDKDNYSVIFEDDVILNENVDKNIKQIISNLINEKLDWDLVFLGNLTMNHNRLIKNNIYTIDKNNCCTGTHALLINNKNIEKIYNSNCNIIHAIDWQYKINIDNKTLNGYVIFPPLCNQNTNFLSNIQ